MVRVKREGRSAWNFSQKKTFKVFLGCCSHSTILFQHKSVPQVTWYVYCKLKALY